MASHPYVGKRSSMVRTLWAARKLVAFAALLGTILWFVWANGAPVKVHLPFGVGTIEQGLGVVILASALVGALASGSLLAVVWTTRKFREAPSASEKESGTPRPHVKVDPEEDELPPPDFVAKGPEGPMGANRR